MAVAYQSVGARSATSGTDPVVPKPSGTVSGDLLIAVGIVAGVQTLTAPSGDGGADWTKHADSLDDSKPLWWKIANGSEPSDYTFVTSGSGSSVVQVARFTGHDPSTPIEDIAGHTATGNLVLPSVDASDVNRVLMQMCVKLNTTSFTPPGTAVELYDATVLSGNLVYAGGYEAAPSGASGTKTWVPASGIQPGVGYNIIISPPLAPETVDGEVDWVFGSTGELTVGNKVDGEFDLVFSSVGNLEVTDEVDAEVEWAFSSVGDLLVESPLDVTSIGNFVFSSIGEVEVGGGGEGSSTDIARFRAASYLGIEEPELSTIDTGYLLREYWGRKAGIVGDLSTYSTMDIISEHFPGSHFIRDVF